MMIISFTENQKEIKILLSSSTYFSTYLQDEILPRMFVSTEHLTLAAE